jgi:hypothetical protein
MGLIKGTVMEVMLVPTYSGVFDPSSKTCVVLLDGNFMHQLCKLFDPARIINLTGDYLYPTLIDQYPNTQNYNIKLEETYRMKYLLNQLDEYNVVIYTEDLNNLSYLINNNIYGFRNKHVGLATASNNTIHNWVVFIKSAMRELDSSLKKCCHCQKEIEHPITFNISVRGIDQNKCGSEYEFDVCSDKCILEAIRFFRKRRQPAMSMTLSNVPVSFYDMVLNMLPEEKTNEN